MPLLYYLPSRPVIPLPPRLSSTWSALIERFGFKGSLQVISSICPAMDIALPSCSLSSSELLSDLALWQQSLKSSERCECLLSTEGKLLLLLGETQQVLELSKVIPTPHSLYFLCTYFYANTFSSHTCFCAYVSWLVRIWHLCKTLLAKKYQQSELCLCY